MAKKKAATEKQTFKVWKGLPNEVTISEWTWNLFWRANGKSCNKEASKRAVARIVKRGLFDTWLQWNHELCIRMDANATLAKIGLNPSSSNWETARDRLIAAVGSEPSAEMYAALMGKVYA